MIPGMSVQPGLMAGENFDLPLEWQFLFANNVTATSPSTTNINLSAKNATTQLLCVILTTQYNTAAGSLSTTLKVNGATATKIVETIAIGDGNEAGTNQHEALFVIEVPQGITTVPFVFTYSNAISSAAMSIWSMQKYVQRNPVDFGSDVSLNPSSKVLNVKKDGVAFTGTGMWVRSGNPVSTYTGIVKDYDIIFGGGSGTRCSGGHADITADGTITITRSFPGVSNASTNTYASFR